MTDVAIFRAQKKAGLSKRTGFFHGVQRGTRSERLNQSFSTRWL